MNGYISHSTSYEVDVTLAECDLLAPVVLMPLTATPEDGCVVMSLTWGEEPQDLDLYSYRVHENNTNDQCLTYFCDHKDPCDGVTFDVDNRNGGNNGTETITYCAGSEGYSNMVYVDDLSGEGSTLLASSARLKITSPTSTREIVLNTTRSASNEDKRYWLAGCLVTDGEGEYEFMQLNQFLDVQPSVEDPLVCHSRLALTEASNNYGPELDATVVISVVDASTNEPLNRVMLSMKNDRESHSRLTGVAGTATLPVSYTGNYSILAEVNNYIQEKQVILVECSYVNCIIEYQISMLPKPTDNGFQISLGWGDGSSAAFELASSSQRALRVSTQEQDLDLHVLQVKKQDTRIICETYFTNPAGCESTTLNHNVQAGGIRKEVVTIADSTSLSGLTTFMIFVDDNSVTSSSIFSSGAKVTITDGLSSRAINIPEVNEDAVAGSKYWLVGCLEFSGSSYSFIPVNTFSRESPVSDEKYLCHNTFQNGGVVEEEEPFCPNVEINIAIRNVLTNDDVNTATASIVVEDGENEFTVANDIGLSNGYISTPISRNGLYIIRVEADGFSATRQELNVATWDSNCYTNYQRKQGCSEAVLDLDNTRGGN